LKEEKREREIFKRANLGYLLIFTRETSPILRRKTKNVGIKEENEGVQTSSTDPAIMASENL